MAKNDRAHEDGQDNRGSDGQGGSHPPAQGGEAGVLAPSANSRTFRNRLTR